jgi:hypothetical protein
LGEVHIEYRVKPEQEHEHGVKFGFKTRKGKNMSLVSLLLSIFGAL